MNAYQAIEEGRPADPRITISIQRESGLDLGIAPKIVGFTVTDNGIGFHDENMDSFNTVYSEYKAQRGGKGLGRMTWLKAYESVDIRSTFYDEIDSSYLERRFKFHEGYSPDHVAVSTAIASTTGTQLTLSGLREPWKSETPSDTNQVAHRLCEHFVLLLMKPDCPQIYVRDGRQNISVNEVFREAFKRTSSTQKFELRGHPFEIISFRLTSPRISKNRVVYCADYRAVITENLDKYIPNLSGRLVDEDDQTFVYLAVVTGPYLDERVNPGRTEFMIEEGDVPDEEASTETAQLFEDEVRRSEIRDEVVEFVYADLESAFSTINSIKLERISGYIASEAPHYRVLMKRSNEFIDRIPRDGSRADLEAALHRELHHREVELRRQGSKILLEASRLEDYDDYQERISYFLENQNEIGVAALAQYVTHRRIILDLFKRAISLDERDNRYPLEKVLHHLIFPMRASSDEILFSQQNLWILDERLNYHSFVGSDLELRQIEGLGSGSAKRPDLTIFDRKLRLTEGAQPINSLTVVEFKRPMRDDYTDEENPLKQVVRAVEEIRSGDALDGEGRTIKVANHEIPTTCYVVCDITPRLREQLTDWGARKTPDGQSYYGYHPNHRIYFEVMDYDTVLSNAERRNRMLFEKLNLL